MGKKLTRWNYFVKKIFHEGKSRNPNYAFKHALREASSRKKEMFNMNIGGPSRKRHYGRRNKTSKRRRRG